MFKILFPFLRLLMVVPLVFALGYLSYFTPLHLLAGEGFTQDLQLCLVAMGISAGLLFYTKPRKELEFFAPGDPQPPQEPEQKP
ncbi:MAG: hypothetical protein A2600_01405 [Candidatus Lambdaproteobacteria bacterium RIFOXYD1_FULL_56_27]|uniref:Uncharacterized protein n=1 Tax=Candidatus Lambdaproteobacteria bacterium RIFOXYD2_FULL_56_26 TaxID=1817773 RepID=A0A1F6GSL3_9PROT|nr:MAG: hypothetical protein A2557_00520 [Candidatus Lambdaproteobacteria bacterium RIFOXYD2_FULL_56_26]OGH01391.1 MAG: hypothetical protein A2426_13355 [Candidatus Lambdaproteobacteria bacterium RIFOXYC1_FULL_56_13]OGH06932.1 MAG: hypothetical protein A2600_01405 [Candidatus Lambdaproteobacteria bacterium RIFOXYD1_FULL_56_27]